MQFWVYIVGQKNGQKMLKVSKKPTHAPNGVSLMMADLARFWTVWCNIAPNLDSAISQAIWLQIQCCGHLVHTQPQILCFLPLKFTNMPIPTYHAVLGPWPGVDPASRHFGPFSHTAACQARCMLACVQ